MSTRSAIEWTEVTWNPVTGCTKISPGCKFCYAERLSRRLQAMGVEKYRDGFLGRHARVYSRRAAEVASAEARVRQFHVRSVPRVSAVRVH